MKKKPVYTIHTDNKRIVVALSTYAGKPVKGIAKCSPEDKFDFDTGKNIAEARCNLAVAIKRCVWARRKVREAYLAKQEADRFYNEMKMYLERSAQDLTKAKCELDSALNEAGVKYE